MRINITKMFVFGLAMLMLASVCVVSAQEVTINGQVRDNDNNNPISGAEVRFTSQNDGAEYYGYTGGGGDYHISDVPDGNYNIRVSAGGYDELHQTAYVDSGNTNFVFTLSSQNDGDGGDGDNGDGDGGGDGDDPFGEITGEFEEMIMYMMMAVALFYTLLIIITIMTIAIFVRLGKIKKATIAMNEREKEKEKNIHAQQQYQQAPQQQYQQPQQQQPPQEQPPSE